MDIDDVIASHENILDNLYTLQADIKTSINRELNIIAEAKHAKDHLKHFDRLANGQIGCISYNGIDQSTFRDCLARWMSRCPLIDEIQFVEFKIRVLSHTQLVSTPRGTEISLSTKVSIFDLPDDIACNYDDLRYLEGYMELHELREFVGKCNIMLPEYMVSFQLSCIPELLKDTDGNLGQWVSAIKRKIM